MVIESTVKRSGYYLGESAAANIVNEEIIVAEGQGELDPGTVLGAILIGVPTVTPGAPVSGSGQTVGNGAVGAWTADDGVADGKWQIVFTNEASNLGNYKVLRPDGSTDGFGTVGTPYNGGINGTLADGSNDWKEDDVIPMAVAYAEKKIRYVAHDPALTNGGQVADAILFHGVDATDDEIVTVATTNGPATIFGTCLTFKDGISSANKATAEAALRKKGLKIIPQHAV